MKTLVEIIRHFSDTKICIDTVARLKWPDGKATCPKCGRQEVLWLANQQRWKCKRKECKKQFSVKVGTIFEDSPISLDKWLVAVWLVANCKNGISSYEVARDLGVTQKSAWFMLHRIRLAMQDGGGMLSRAVEMDETFIGGKVKNMHKSKGLWDRAIPVRLWRASARPSWLGCWSGMGASRLRWCRNAPARFSTP